MAQQKHGKKGGFDFKAFVQAAKAQDQHKLAGLPGAEVEREEVLDERTGKLVGVIVRDRFKVAPLPPDLKQRSVQRVFVKRNTFTPEHDSNRKPYETTALVVNFDRPQPAIKGLPALSAAEERKLIKCGFTHFVVRRVGRDETLDSEPDEYNESGWEIEWYKAAGGSQQEGGESVHRVRDELTVLHYLLSQNFEALWDIEALKRNFLPETDNERIKRNQELPLGVDRDPESYYHNYRLTKRFEEKFRQELIEERRDQAGMVALGSREAGFTGATPERLTGSDEMSVRERAGEEANKFWEIIRKR